MPATAAGPCRTVLVTGTDTGVGKTMVAAAIARSHARHGCRVAVFKPVQSGDDEASEPDHLLLRRAAGSSQDPDEISPYRFGPPLSPHRAAELSDRAIDMGRLVAAARAAADGADVLVVEGAGGLLVPLDDELTVRDLFAVLTAELDAVTVIVARPGLGTINHTLLTLEAADQGGLAVLGVVLTPWPAEPGEPETSNRTTLLERTMKPVLTLERFDPADETWPELALG
ncbi:MAG: dethiobiotin synthase [Solirubrobacterales bacterium]